MFHFIHINFNPVQNFDKDLGCSFKETVYLKWFLIIGLPGVEYFECCRERF